MPTTAVSAHGSLIKVGDAGSPESFTTLFEVRNFTGIGISLNPIDATHQSSTNHYKEFIGGLLDSGEVSGECNWKPDNATQSAAAGIVYLQSQRTARNFQIVTSHGSPVTATFAAIITQIGPVSFDMEGALVLPFSFKVSGAYSWS